MYRPLPNELTIKNSPIEGLGLFANQDIKKHSFIGVTHVRDEQFENKYIRTPIGGFYNHSNDPNVIRMVSDILPKLNFGDQIDPTKSTQELKKGENNVENSFYHLQEKSDAKYMFLITVKDIKTGEEIKANYNLYTCLLYTSPSPRDRQKSRMPSSA